MELLEKLERRILKDNPTFDQAKARLAIEEAFHFLKSAVNHSTPSLLADAGWHAFILHTKEYEEWCMTNVGRFIHHNPCYEDDIIPCDGDCYFSKNEKPYDCDYINNQKTDK